LLSYVIKGGRIMSCSLIETDKDFIQKLLCLMSGLCEVKTVKFTVWKKDGQFHLHLISRYKNENVFVKLATSTNLKNLKFEKNIVLKGDVPVHLQTLCFILMEKYGIYSDGSASDVDDLVECDTSFSQDEYRHVVLLLITSLMNCDFNAEHWMIPRAKNNDIVDVVQQIIQCASDTTVLSVDIDRSHIDILNGSTFILNRIKFDADLFKAKSETILVEVPQYIGRLLHLVTLTYADEKNLANISMMRNIECILILCWSILKSKVKNIDNFEFLFIVDYKWVFGSKRKTNN
jgi:hypothetical protein